MFWRYNNTKVIWGGNMNNKKIKAEIKVKDNTIIISRYENYLKFVEKR